MPRLQSRRVGHHWRRLKRHQTGQLRHLEEQLWQHYRCWQRQRFGGQIEIKAFDACYKTSDTHAVAGPSCKTKRSPD